MKRMKEDVEKVRAQRETIKQHEEIISELTNTVKKEIALQGQLHDKKKGMTGADVRELEIEAKEMRYETEKLRERLKYVNTVKGMNGGQIPVEDAEKLREIEIQENSEEYEGLKERQEELMGQL